MPNEEDRRGLIIIHNGNGKGKPRQLWDWLSCSTDNMEHRPEFCILVKEVMKNENRCHCLCVEWRGSI